MKQIIISIVFLFVGCEYDNSGVTLDDLFKSTGTDLWPVKVVEYNKNAAGPKIALMGDSRIDLWNVGQYTDKHIYNLAQWGNTTGGVLIRIPHLANINPDKIFVSVGVNDLGLGMGAGLADRIKQIIINIKKMCPVAEIYVTGIVPGVFIKTDEYNTKIAAVCLEENANFIDLSAMENESGYIKDEFADGTVHYNSAGYSVFSPLLVVHFN